MESITEIKIPLLWNANGYVEVIQQDDVSPIEAEKVIKLFECNIATDNENVFSPSSSSSNDFSSESDCQEKLSLGSIEEERFDMDRGYDDPVFENVFQSSNKIRRKKDKFSVLAVPKSVLSVHVCHICDKRFSRKFNLNTHIKCVHSDDKDYVCLFCQRAFNHSSNLRKHTKTVHGDEKRLHCPICKKPFKQMEALKSHGRIIHNVDDIDDC